MSDTTAELVRSDGPARRPPRHRRAYLLAEFLVALTLALALLALIAATMVEYQKMRRFNDTRQVLRMAAEAQLNLLRAGVESTPEDVRLPRSAKLTVQREPGEGVWADFTRVTVRATRPAPPRDDVVIELSTYIPTAELAP